VNGISMWALNVLIAILAALNTLFWGLCIREVGSPSMSLDFLFKLGFNRFFILALASAFIASLLTYSVLASLGVMRGRFFLATGAIATILVAHFILGERMEPIHWLGIGLILIGALLLGRW